MLLRRDHPARAYRRAAFDARVRGASAADLVIVCLDETVESLVRALAMEGRGMPHRQAEWLAHAHAAVAALEGGIADGAPLTIALRTFYAAARRKILGAMTRFDADRVMQMKADFTDIAVAMRAV